jgi:hypothetical protein
MSVSLPIRIGAQLLDVDVQISVRNGSALALARLADAVQNPGERISRQGTGGAIHGNL